MKKTKINMSNASILGALSSHSLRSHKNKPISISGEIQKFASCLESSKYMLILCAILYHLYSLKNVKPIEECYS